MSGNEEGGGLEQFSPGRMHVTGASRGSTARSMQLLRGSGSRAKMGTADRSKLEEAIRHHFHHENAAASGETADQHQMDGTVHFRQFLSTLLEKDPKYFRAALERLRSERAPLLVICETLVIPVAEELGRLWCEDQQNFANITAASARLQLLLTSLSDVEGPSFYDEERPRILLMRMPSNDHTLGLSVIASVFHEEGWSVEGGPSLQAGNQAYGMARNGGYRMIGISVAVDSTAEEVSSSIRRIRTACPDPSVPILVGGPCLGNREQELRAAGADIVAVDVRQAIQMANALITGDS
jgi:methylmalonyl-CoA mutase cobalamin-binding subunit